MLVTLTLQKVVEDENEIEDLLEQLESLGYHVDVETYDEDESPDYSEVIPNLVYAEEN